MTPSNSQPDGGRSLGFRDGDSSRAGAAGKIGLSFAILLTGVLGAQGQVFLFSPSVAVPDGRGDGLADRRTVAGAPAVSAVSVGLTFTGLGEGMVNGDLYATLSHEDSQGVVDAFVVLLNRPGKRADNDEGYFDSGLSIDLVPGNTAPDVHNYRVTLGGNHGVPLGGALSGTWSPDGRATDPDMVLDTDPRSTSLDDFTGIDPNTGRWVLFVADLLEGGEARLDQWNLSFTATVVPEPSWYLVGVSCGLGAFALGRRRKRALHR